MLFDTHTHFNFNAFKDDWKETIKHTLDQNVWIINVGAESKTSQRASEISKKYPEGVFASVGLHPIHTYDDELEEEIKGEKVKFVTKAEDFDKEFYRLLILDNPKIVAIGETGLDYFHIKKFDATLQKELKKKQKEIFSQQIDLAIETNKPLILHCRPNKNFEAYWDLLDILKSKDLPSLPGIVHCFSANLEIEKEFLEMGFFLGFNGIITFTDQYNELVINAPIEKIVTETDAPWLAPVPYRGKRNESIYVAEVARKIGDLKGLSFEIVAQETVKNAKKIFQI